VWFTSETFPVTFRARPDVADPTGGMTKGNQFVDAFTRQANCRDVTGREIAEAGKSVDSIDCIIRIRDGVLPRSITAEYRARLQDQDYEIVTVGRPHRRDGYIEMTLRRQLGAT
jgi:SPP1 family predicted phage head-tail adaptor